MKLEHFVVFLVVTALVVAYFIGGWTQWCSKVTMTGKFMTPARGPSYSSPNHTAPGGSNGRGFTPLPESEVDGVAGKFTTTTRGAPHSVAHNKDRFIPLTKSEVNGVEKFVLFIGHSRSGHSIISAMMDAHPNIVIANEYHVLQECVLESTKVKSKAALFNGLYKDSYAASKSGRSEGNELKNPRGYNLHVNTSWQGSFSQLKVIGDKDGGGLAGLFTRHFLKTTACFNRLKETINIPIVLLHVIRNPFDMIATIVALKHGVPNTRQKLLEGMRLRVTGEKILKVAEAVFRKAKAFTQAITSEAMKDLVVVEIHSENFIKHPQEHINKICKALDVPCPEEYVEACSEKVYKNISKSRKIIEWDDDVVDKILEMMKNFPFFSGYTLSSESI